MTTIMAGKVHGDNGPNGELGPFSRRQTFALGRQRVRILRVKLTSSTGRSIVASLTVENYVKAVYQLTGGEKGHAASTGELATAMRVSPGTVTSMLKSLSSNGLVMYKPYAGACLTEEGHSLAVRLLRRYRLARLFLSQTLNVPVDKVDVDAEQIAHVLSDFLAERIDAHLGHPNLEL